MELRTLVEQAKTGDPAAMGELYQATNQRVYALALRLTGNPDKAMDVVQESYLSALQNLEGLRNPDAFLSWIFQIAANRCRKLHNQARRFASPGSEGEETDYFDALPDPDEKLLPEAVVDSGETRRLMAELVDSLPEAQRECVILYYFSQCSVEQIAQIQACTQGTVKSRLNYGRKKLKEGVLALEARDGIRLHSLVPIGPLFACVGSEVPDPDSLLHIWQNIAAGMGTAGVATASAGAASTAAGSQTAAGGASVAAKGAVGAVKLKIAAGVTAGAVLAGGAGIALSQPAVTFSDPVFEQNIRVILDKPSGAIRASDLEQIKQLWILDDGMTTKTSGEALQGTQLVSSLEDIALLSELSRIDYQVTDGGALLDSLPEQESIQTAWVNTDELDAPGIEDLSFLERLPNLRALYLHTEPGIDLTLLETKTSLMGLSLFSESDTTLDVSQLTQLRFLDYWGDSDIDITLETTAELPYLKILTLPGGSNFLTPLDILSYMPALEYVNLNAVEDTDLTPVAQLTQLRGIELSYDGPPVDLTPLLQCPSLEMCFVPNQYDGMTIPPELPLGTLEQIKAIEAEIFQEIGEEIRG
ncbi:hypothetical protein I4200191B4_12520 [Pseudoflavonifractor gallinarum]|uniref:sigma-70 family RNA polymerase sigma factor n=1 Tax=Pseudoflavonifractor gallinarum TaxID=2779352 RepID=UPI0036F35CA2